MGITKKILEFEQIECSSCNQMCNRTSEDIVRCMDKTYSTSNYNQEHLNAVRDFVKETEQMKIHSQERCPSCNNRATCDSKGDKLYQCYMSSLN